MLFVRLTIAVALLGMILIAPQAICAAIVEDPYVIGDRVELNTGGGLKYPGTIYNVQDGRYQVERDGYGRTSDWVTAADLRRLPGTVVAPSKPAAAADETYRVETYKVGDRVEWNTGGGITFPGTIVSAQDGRYQIDRDCCGRAGEQLTAADLRRLSPEAAPPPAADPTPAAQAAAANETYRVGDRVEWNTGGGTTFPGTIVSAQDGRYQIDRDCCGRAREQLTAADLRRLGPDAAAPPAAGPTPAAQAAPANEIYRVGDRVEWNTGGGITFPGTIVSAQDGRYQIDRDCCGRGQERVTAADLRRLGPDAPTTTPAAGPAPAAQAAAANEIYRVGDRVEWNTGGGITFPGTIVSAQDGRYQIDRDCCGRAQERVTAADLRRLGR